MRISSAASIVIARLDEASDAGRLVAAGDDLYVIFGGRSVQRFILNGLPFAELMTQVMRWREGANDLVMGQPVDMYLDGARLLIFDSLGSLWSYWGATYTRALVPLRLQSNQGVIRSIAVHGTDLLLLDPTRRAIWRYRRDAAGGYMLAPRPLELPATVGLAGAQRIAAGSQELLVLEAGGRVAAITWRHLGAARVIRASARVTGIWAAPASPWVLLSTAHRIAWVTAAGRVWWSGDVSGLGGDTIRDVGYSPSGRIYVLTRRSIRRVLAPLPPGL